MTTTTERLDRIAHAWSVASDREVAAALNRQDDYDNEVFVVIRNEAQKREVSAQDFTGEPDQETWEELKARAFEGIAHVRPAFPTRWAIFTAISYAMFMFIVAPSSAQTALGMQVRALLVYGGHEITLAFLLWNVRTQRDILKITRLCAAITWIGFALFFAVPTLTTSGQGWSLLTALSIVVVFPGTWLTFYLPIGLTLWVRNCWWPVYPHGHCQFCGYNLTGLPAPRCPECGRTFEAKQDQSMQRA